MKYKGLETSFPLLCSYETLALDYKKRNSPQTYDASWKTPGNVFEDVPSKSYENYSYSFALLVLNASIIEGTLRSILSEVVASEVESQIAKGTAEGRTQKSPPELLLSKFQNEIDAAGGWDKLKEQYSTYLGFSIDKEIGSETKSGLDTLFLLRNIFAHGTAIVHPVEKFDEDLKDVYPYKWQSRLQGARVYLEKNFGHSDIFDNLAEFGLPAHFMGVTKIFFKEFSSVYTNVPQRVKRTLSTIETYSFGYRNI